MTTLTRVLTLFWKELLALWMDPRGRMSLLVPPLVQGLVFGYAATFDLSGVPVAVLDQDRSEPARELIARFTGARAFQEVARLTREDDIARVIDSRRATLVLRIGQDFGRDLLAGRGAKVQLAVDAPVYQGGAVSAKVRAAQGQRQAAQADVEKAKLDINQKASTAYADMIGGQQRQVAGEEQYGSATHTRSVYQDEYKLSKRSLNDLLSVEQDVFQADTMRIGALYDGWDATVRYAAAVDNLVDMLGIDRQKQTGDTIPSL